MRIPFTLIPVIALLAGCTTTLNTQHVSPNGQPKPGVLYNLPIAVFEIEATFLVTSCRVNENDILELGYQLSDSKINHSLAPDSLETYRLNYSLLNSSLKTTAASIVMHPNGMIKTVNAEVDDRTAQVVTALAGTALNLIKASTISFLPTSAAVAKNCDGFIIAKLSERKKLIESDIPQGKADDKALAADKEAADEISVELEVAKTKLAEAQKAKDNVAIAEATKEIAGIQPRLAVAIQKLTGRTLKAPALQSKLTLVTDALTVTAKLTNWAPRPPGSEICEEVSVDQKGFYERLALANATFAPIYKPAPTAKFAAEACVSLAPNPRNAAVAVDKQSDAAEEEYEGVVYRLPTTGSVYVRQKSNPSQRFYASATVSLPQFGAKGLVWLKNSMFDNNTVKATFNEDGSMSELTFTAKSQAERAAGAASDVSKTVVDLMQLRADTAKAKAAAVDAEQKSIQQKQIDAIDNQIALLEKRKALESARNPSKDTYDKQKDQLQKEIDVEKLRQELDALKKKAIQP